MGVTKQIWKFSWNPAGYPIEQFSTSTGTISVNPVIKLQHSYFKIEGFVAYTITKKGTKLFYKCNEIKVAGTDFLFNEQDITLSTLAGKSIYSSLKMCSSRVENLSNLIIECSYIADVIDADSLNQDLHQEASVEHKHLKVVSLDSKQANIAEIESEMISGTWGELTPDSFVLNDSAQINGTNISKNGFESTFPVDSLNFGNKDFNVSFDVATKTAKLQVGEKRGGVLFHSLPDISQIPIYGIPVVLSDDRARLNFVPWFSLDPTNKGIKIGSLNIDENTLINKGSIDIAKKEVLCNITLCNDNFLSYNKQTGDVSIFNNLIFMNVITKKVVINGITFSTEFFNSISQMQRDIAFLKERIK